MHFTGIASPEQLSTMTEVLDDWCRAHIIVDGAEREEVGRLIISLFQLVCRTEAEFSAGLQQLSPHRIAA